MEELTHSLLYEAVCTNNLSSTRNGVSSKSYKMARRLSYVLTSRKRVSIKTTLIITKQLKPTHPKPFSLKRNNIKQKNPMSSLEYIQKRILPVANVEILRKHVMHDHWSCRTRRFSCKYSVKSRVLRYGGQRGRTKRQSSKYVDDRVLVIVWSAGVARVYPTRMRLSTYIRCIRVNAIRRTS